MTHFVRKPAKAGIVVGACVIAFASNPAIATPVQWTVASGGNDHWYEFIYVPGGITWNNARIAAAAASFSGLPGYLATVTSKSENDFIYALAKYPAGTNGDLFDPANPGVSLGPIDISGQDALTWLGASDAGAEGTWRWINGPETGTIFWVGDSTGSAPGGAFAFWDNPTSSGDPTGNEPSNSGGAENWLQIRYSGGSWNDTTSGATQVMRGTQPVTGYRTHAPAAYIVEYSPATSPVTFTVINNNDNGSGSLREAVTLANQAPGPNTINFAANVTGTILLTSGQLNINEALTIVGPGAGILTIDANANSRVFSIFQTDPACPALDGPDYLVSISGLRLTNAQRHTSNGAGAIFTEHSLALDSMTIDNSIAGTGGGLYFQIQYPSQSLSITNSQFLNNKAQPIGPSPGTDQGGALAIFEKCSGTYTGPVTVGISGSIFSGNQAVPVAFNGWGGAISTDSHADITISDTRIINNSAVAPNPPVAGQSYRGGAIYGVSKSLTIQRSEISGNGALDATASDVTRGGGLNLTNYANDRQTLAELMTVKFINSTISGNLSSATAGAMLAFGNIAIELDNSTMSNNTTTDTTRTGGIVLATGATTPPSAGNATIPTLTLVSSILAKNSSVNGDVATNAPTIPSLTIAATNSMIETICSTCSITISGTGNILATDPLLGLLANHGGPTQTQALLVGSPAIDAGSNPLALTTDQRGTGFPRVVGPAADIGAYEGSVLPGPPVLVGAKSRRTHGAAGPFDLAL